MTFCQLPFAVVWNAFTDLRNIRYVYLPYFLESFLAKNPGLSDALRTMVAVRSIDFQPEGRAERDGPVPGADHGWHPGEGRKC
jgi:hypothetical protein